MKKFKLKFILLLLAATFIIGNISALSTSDALTVPKVKSLSTASRTSTSIKLKWSKVSSSSGYEIYRSTSKSGKYTLVKTLSGSSSTTYTNTKLTSNKTYYYKVRAYKIYKKKYYYGSYSSILKTYTSKPSNSTVMKAYRSFLEKNQYIKPEKYDGSIETYYFKIMDINKDGIKELLVTNKSAYNKSDAISDNGYSYVYVYTYKDNKVKYSGKASSSSFTRLYINTKGNLSYNWGGFGAIQYMNYGLNSSTKKLNITTYTSQEKVDSNYNIYYIYYKTVADYDVYNSKPITISKSTFDSQAKSVRSSDTFTMIKDTSSNRSKYLK